MTTTVSSGMLASPGRRNLFINGSLKIWQRGTSAAVNQYAADRWESGGAGNQTQSRQAGGSSDDWQYVIRHQRDSGTTGAGTVLGYAFEEKDSIPLRGKTVTFSAYLRKGADYSPTSDIITMAIRDEATTPNRSFRYYGAGNNTNLNITLTSSWVRHSVTATLSSSMVGFACGLATTRTGTAGANDYFEMANAQLEIGSVASDFEYRSFGEELALCQRYYEKSYADGVYPGNTTSAGAFSYQPGPIGAQFSRFTVRYTTQKRIGSPTVTIYATASGTANKLRFNGSSDQTASGVQLSNSSFTINSNFATYTAGDFFQLHFVSDAEL